VRSGERRNRGDTNLYFIHPLASRPCIFCPDALTPNAVSVTGMLFGILSAFADFRYSDVRVCDHGFALMIAWHVMDGAMVTCAPHTDVL